MSAGICGRWASRLSAFDSSPSLLPPLLSIPPFHQGPPEFRRSLVPVVILYERHQWALHSRAHGTQNLGVALPPRIAPLHVPCFCCHLVLRVRCLLVAFFQSTCGFPPAFFFGLAVGGRPFVQFWRQPSRPEFRSQAERLSLASRQVPRPERLHAQPRALRHALHRCLATVHCEACVGRDYPEPAEGCCLAAPHDVYPALADEGGSAYRGRGRRKRLYLVLA